MIGIRNLAAEPAEAQPADIVASRLARSELSGAPRTIQDDSGTIHDAVVDANRHRIKRLERLAALDRSARPALAAARALEAAYAHDDVASEAAMADFAEFLGGAK